MNQAKNFLCLLLVLFMAGAISCKQNEGTDKDVEPSKAESNINKVDPDEALDRRIEETKHLQEQRKEFIDGMLEAGLAMRIENPNSEPFVYVTEPFYLLSRSEQASMMNAIWYYYITEDRNVDELTIYDDATGNEIGTFGRKGLLMAE